MSYKRLSGFLYGVLVVVTVFLIGYLALTTTNESKTDIALQDAIGLDESWMDASGNVISDTRNLNDVPGASKDSETSIFYTLPSELEEGKALNFRAKHLFFKVYIDGELIYEPDIAENRLYTDSIGAVWVFIPLKTEYAGKDAELRFTLCYDNSPCGIDKSVIANERGELLAIISDKVGAFVLAIIFITVGLTLMIADIPMNWGRKGSHELLFLGIMSISIATYCLVETQLFQLFIGDERIVHLITWLSLLLIPTPLVLYIDEFFGFKYKNTTLIYSLVAFGFYFVAFFLNCFEVADYHTTSTGIHGLIFASIIILVITVVRDGVFSRKRNVENTDKAFAVLQFLGLIIMAFSGIIDIVRYRFFNASDSAAFIRIGMLFFIIFFGIASLRKTIQAVRAGAKAEVVHKLAYTDGLTELGNRTAYVEIKEELSKQKQRIGVIMLDVNDLKVVNDNFGHAAGDTLLTESANFIRKAFSSLGGMCYRIGGDEFVVFINDDHARDYAKEGIKKLHALCNERNEENSKKSDEDETKTEFDISIACGYAVFGERKSQKSMDEVCAEADYYMYENKKKMKGKKDLE